MPSFELFEIIRADEFDEWLNRLRDSIARQAIEARILRLHHGNFGDAKAIGDGLSELHIHAGPGYRVYFTQHGYRVIILLCGGDKGSQQRDIAAAHRIAGRSGKRSMPTGFSRWDAAANFRSEEDARLFVAEVARDGSAAELRSAIGAVARYLGVLEIARRSGMSPKRVFTELNSLDEDQRTLKLLMKRMGIEPSAPSGTADAAE